MFICELITDNKTLYRHLKPTFVNRLIIIHPYEVLIQSLPIYLKLKL